MGPDCRLSTASAMGCAPLPSAFINQICVSSMVVSEEVSPRVVPSNAMARPSGDQRGSYTTLSVCVSLRTVPSETRTAKMSRLKKRSGSGSRFDRNRISSPRGDQSMECSCASPFVSWRTCRDSTSTTKMCSRRLSLKYERPSPPVVR